jgi:hypothetical protein
LIDASRDLDFLVAGIILQRGDASSETVNLAGAVEDPWNADPQPELLPCFRADMAVHQLDSAGDHGLQESRPSGPGPRPGFGRSR